MTAPFNQTSFGQALIRSREEGKAIFAYFYSESISDQKNALGQVLSVDSVIEWLETNTVPISINVEKKQLKTINDEPILPWCLFLSPNLRQLGQIYEISQIHTESRFIALAEEYVNGDQSLSYAKKSVSSKDVNNPLDWLILARVYSEWGYDMEAEKIILEWVQRRVEHRHCFSYIQGVFMWGLCYDCFENSDRIKVNLYKRRNDLRNQIIQPKFNDFAKLLEFVRLNRFLTEQRDTMELYEKLSQDKVKHFNTLNHLMEIEYERFYEREMFEELFSSIDIVAMVEEAIVTHQEEKKWILDTEEENNSEISDIESLNAHLRRQLCTMYEVLLRNNENELAGQTADRLLTILPDAESYSLLASSGSRTGNSLFRDLEYAQKAFELEPNHLTYASNLRAISLKILENRSLKAPFREELKSIINNIDRDYPSLA